MKIYYIRVNIGPAKLLLFLARHAKQGPSRLALALIIVTSLAAGVADTDLTLIDRGGWLFLVLCLALPLCRFVSRALLRSLTQNSLNDLRRRILSSHRDRHVPAPMLQALRYRKPARDRWDDVFSHG